MRPLLLWAPSNFAVSRAMTSSIGSPQDDWLDGGRGTDSLQGGNGNDTYVFGNDHDSNEMDTLTETARNEDRDTLDFGAVDVTVNVDLENKAPRYWAPMARAKWFRINPINSRTSSVARPVISSGATSGPISSSVVPAVTKSTVEVATIPCRGTWQRRAAFRR